MSALFDESNNIVSGTLNIGSGSVYDIVLSETSGYSTIFNQNNLDIDFAVSGTGIGDVLYYDASTSRLGLNTDNPDSALHIVTDCALDGLKIESQTNCATGVRLLLLHNSQTLPETGSYPVTIDLAGRDNNYTTINYAQIKSRILNPDTANTSGEILFTVDYTGINKEIFRASVYNTVLGGLNTVDGHEYNILGTNNITSGLMYIVVGNNNDTIHDSGIIIGNINNLSGNNIVFLGNNNNFIGDNSIALLVNSEASGNNSILIGDNIQTTGINTTLIGHTNVVETNNFMGLANNANIFGDWILGFGNYATINSDMAIYIGHNVNISGNNPLAIGTNIDSSGANNIVFGNDASVVGDNIISIGINNESNNTISGISIGNNVLANNSENFVIIGLNNSLSSGLQNSMIVGLNNTTHDSQSTGLVLFGESNNLSYVSESLILGNKNNLSGLVLNNIVVGPRNTVPDTSKNNLVIGILNNITGITINSDGSIVGTDTRAEGNNMINTNIFGINNWVTSASGSTIIGNKTRISGLNINNVGSYVNINGINNQSIGNSNFIVGNNNIAVGNKNDLFGFDSISMNTRSDRNQLFGSGNIVMGHNEMVVSGLTIGYDNEIYGPNNLIFGKHNDLGIARYPCRVSGNNIVIAGAVDDFVGGDHVMVGLYSPASQIDNVYISTILDGTDINNDPLGVITENLGGGYFTTTLVVSPSFSQESTIEYFVKDHFDNIIQGQDPCDICFSDLYSGYASGYVIAYRKGGDEEDIYGNPFYGNNNIIFGSQNIVKHHSGIIIGNQNNISGTNHIALGFGLNGGYNNTVQIGSNNYNKILFDDNIVVFNTGGLQSYLYVNTSSTGVADNADFVQVMDLLGNKVGINTNVPLYTLDVGGTVRADNIILSDGAVNRYALISDGNGVASWQLPVYLSGSNSGLLFKAENTVGSGVTELFFNPESGVKSFEYLRANKLYHSTHDLEPGFVEERAVIINQTGMFLNIAGNDYGYNFVVRGSGIQDPVNGDNSVYLLKTDIEQNSIRIHNVSGVSGFITEFTISSGLILPLNLTGTVLQVSNNGLLRSFTAPRHSVLFNSSAFTSTGNADLRYYSDSQALTIGGTGIPPIAADSSLQQGFLNTFNHAIIGGKPGVDTVFNNLGNGNQFSVLQSGQAGSRLGLHYHTHYGSLGINVANTNLWNVSNTSLNRPWWEAGSLVVNGKIRATGLQLTAQGVTLPGSASLNKYLKIIDENGNVGLDTLDLSYQFSGIHPLSVATDESNSIVSVRLATTNYNGVSLNTSNNGLNLVWNGSSWVHGRGYSFPQPENGSTNTDATPGIELGNDLSLNSCRNNHVFGAGSFARGVTNFSGSSQNSVFYLRGRTGGVVTTELTSNWHKNASSSPDAENTISLQYLDDYDNISPIDHKRTMVWNYTVNYSAIFSDDAGTPTFGACAGKVEGSLLSYIASDGTRTTIKLGSDSITKRYSIADYSSTNPITVDIENTGDNLNTQRLAIKANGTLSTGAVALNGMWSVVVDINQVFMPSGINFGDSGII